MTREDPSVEGELGPRLAMTCLPDAANKRQQWILSHFEKTHKTESAFYLTFCRLDRNDIAYLKAYWHLDDDWAVFRKLCMLYKIKVA